MYKLSYKTLILSQLKIIPCIFMVTISMLLVRVRGNFNPKTDPARFNLVDPPSRNTVGTTPGGWVAIRFVADNPGVWLMHCHLDAHIVWGLAMVFLVENGVGELQTLEPPPLDLPQC